MRCASFEQGPTRKTTKNWSWFEVFGQDTTEYTILSHTWGRDEVTLDHVPCGTARVYAAYDKVISAIQEAASDGLEYIWIDSCCIDKSSSAGLSESINPIYASYERSEICYAILEDAPGILSVDFRAKFVSSRWFTRGWTLQELLAPKRVLLYAKTICGGWTPPLGDRTTLAKLMSELTSIEIVYLTGLKGVHRASIAKRMSWATTRQTKREDDLAYCLMGLFSVNMSMLYSEGIRAFTRLQEEIMKILDDQSIFAWTDVPKEIAATGRLNRVEKFCVLDINFVIPRCSVQPVLGSRSREFHPAGAATPETAPRRRELSATGSSITVPSASRREPSVDVCTPPSNGASFSDGDLQSDLETASELNPPPFPPINP
jgi:hypothetical protein